MPKKEWLLIFASVIITLLLSVVLIRWFAPQLLGIPVDLQLVQTSEKIPPFYENVFRGEVHESEKYIINDPNTIIRSKPLFPDIGWRGPNDILGFRNLYVPNAADIVITGDSQTYSENVAIEQSWPYLLKNKLSSKYQEVYSMATGGWDAVRYLEIYPKMLLLNPKITIVAYYSGNDALESFSTAYGSERFTHLRTNRKIDKTAVPDSPHKWPTPPEHIWPVRFSDGSETGFTPAHRYRSNTKHPAVDTGYEILLLTAQKISHLAKEKNVIPVFTIIPTKELVFEKKILEGNYTTIRHYNDLKDVYLKLVEAEKKRVDWLSAEIKKIPNAVYIDLLPSLQAAAFNKFELYPNDDNGHPYFEGYDVIAETFARSIDKYIQPPINEGIVLRRSSFRRYLTFLYKDQKLWYLSSKEILN
jgi:lysophospholipase L1-like esterase